MEGPQTEAIDFGDQEKYNDEYLSQLILLSFSYFDHHIDKDKYQSGLENLTGNFGSIIKPQLIKMQLKYLIDFIDKYPNADGKFIESFLLNIKMKKEMINFFLQKMNGYNERIETFKNAMFEKITNQLQNQLIHQKTTPMNVLQQLLIHGVLPIYKELKSFVDEL